MAWRGVVVSRPAALRLESHCCVVDGEDGAIRLAFEDISYLVLDTPQVTLTGALLARLAETNVLLVSCDARHMPCGALLPLQGHFRQTASFRLQLALTEAARRRLWQRLIRGKIVNQGRVLARLHGPAAGKAFAAMAERVEPGDPANVEARAARDYFARLFKGFRRRRDDGDRRNAMLNYAYALLRAALARGLAAQGFHPALGLHHDGVDNAFNLADDVIEPWRPLADLHVARHLAASGSSDGAGDELTLTDRRELARLLVADVRLGDEGVMSVVAAIDRQIDGLHAAFAGREASLLPVPEMVE